MTNKYGLRLKTLREERGYTQEELAKLLHTSRSRIAMYEQGNRQPDFEMQEAIADFFNVSHEMQHEIVSILDRGFRPVTHVFLFISKFY